MIVVPNHVPHLDFLEEWPELKPYPIIVVQDIGELDRVPEGFRLTVYTHADIKRDLGEDAWIIPSQTSACRSYGYLKAWQAGAEHIFTLDNDCYPDGSRFVEGHLASLDEKVTLDWVPSVEGIYTRGFPYGIREKSPVWLSHGLWSGVPDLDAPTSLHHPDLRLSPAMKRAVIPRHNYFPMCGMNMAWKRELTPALYFGLFGPQYGFDQYDDIWAGVLCKRVIDHLGIACMSGYPSVEHRKQSNVYVNLAKQAPGLGMNEDFWQSVKSVELTEDTVIGAYGELIRGLPDMFPSEPDGWTMTFKKAALLWLSMFS